MKRNNFVNILTNFFVILFFFYISSLLGILLIILRLICRKSSKDYIGIYFLITGCCVLSMQLFEFITINETVNNFFNNILTSDFYITIYETNNKIFLIGILLIMIRIIIEKLMFKAKKGIKSYIKNSEKENYKIKQENDLEIKLKREQVRNIQNVICPFCGADNLLLEHSGKCKYCRKNIVQKNK